VGGMVAGGGARKCLHKKPQTENAHMSTHKYSCNCFSRYAVVDNDHVVWWWSHVVAKREQKKKKRKKAETNNPKTNRPPCTCHPQESPRKPPNHPPTSTNTQKHTHTAIHTTDSATSKNFYFHINKMGKKAKHIRALKTYLFEIWSDFIFFSYFFFYFFF